MSPSDVNTRERIQAGIYGALVGDALGVPVEFSERGARDADPVAEMRAWGTWSQPAGTWSDDGALLLCTVEGLTTRYAPNELGALFVQWMSRAHWSARNKVFDIGGATLTALERIHSGVSVEASGMTEEKQNGNGSLMRILPVALKFGLVLSPGELARRAMEVSRITHAHPRSQLACAFYCLMAAAVLQGNSAEGAYAAAIERMNPLFKGFPQERAAFQRILSGSLRVAERSQIASSGYVIDTLEASLWCVLGQPSFETAVLTAVNLGGDTDTTGCVTGGLAGVLHGLSAIPQNWIEVLPRQKQLASLIDAFAPTCEPSRGD